MGSLDDRMQIASWDGERDRGDALAGHLNCSGVGAPPRGENFKLIFDILLLSDLAHRAHELGIGDRERIFNFDCNPCAELRDLLVLAHTGDITSDSDIERDPQYLEQR
jgi:hypothetical protein